MAESLGLTELAARALCNLGLAKSLKLDFEGAAADLERSVALARSVSSPEEARGLHNLGSTAWFRADLAQTAVYAGRRLLSPSGSGCRRWRWRAARCFCSAKYNTGHWDEALGIADDLIGAARERDGELLRIPPSHRTRSRIGLARGRDDELVLADARRAVEAGRSAKDSQALAPSLSQLVFVTAELGRLDEARDAARELASLVSGASPVNAHRTVEAAWFAQLVGYDDALRRLALTAPEGHTWREVVLAVLGGDLERAAEFFAALGHVDEGYARLRVGERHLAENRPSEGEAQLRQSIAFFSPLGATRYVRQAEALLAGAGLEVSA